jgi:hypothetical protein
MSDFDLSFCKLFNEIHNISKQIQNKKYYEKNKEKFAEKSKDYYEKNKEKLAAKSKEYYQIHKEEIIDKIRKNQELKTKIELNSKEMKCDCGKIFTREHKARHERSQKHIKYIQEKKELNLKL